MNFSSQFQRHVIDLATDSFEGQHPREARFRLFRQAVEIATPTVFDVLEHLNSSVLANEGNVERDPLPDEALSAFACRWLLTWPEQQQARHRITGAPLEPVIVAVAFPPDYTHPHIGENKPATSETIWAWPFQVTSPADAEDLRFVLEAVAAASLHERIYQADSAWMVIPEADRHIT